MDRRDTAFAILRWQNFQYDSGGISSGRSLKASLLEKVVGPYLHYVGDSPDGSRRLRNMDKVDMTLDGCAEARQKIWPERPILLQYDLFQGLEYLSTANYRLVLLVLILRLIKNEGDPSDRLGEIVHIETAAHLLGLGNDRAYFESIAARYNDADIWPVTFKREFMLERPA